MSDKGIVKSGLVPDDGWKFCQQEGITFSLWKEGGFSLLVVEPEELKRKLSPEQHANWCRWSRGITCVEGGFYLHDVESFLAGLPNLD